MTGIAGAAETWRTAGASKTYELCLGGVAVRTKLLTLGGLLAGLLTVAGPVFAHHAWHGYSSGDQTTVKGTVTEFDWGNPHVWISFEVRNDKGNVEKWNAGGPSPNRMANTGWDKDTLKPGDQITAIGNRSNDGSNLMRLAKVVLQDGRELLCYGKR
jgi:hypothetical protein